MAGALVTTNILATTVSMGLNALRQRLVLAILANREYEQEITAAKRNATVSISIPSAITARTVAPDVIPPAVPAVTPTSIPLTLTEWKEGPFAMDDKGLQQVDRGILPMQATEGVKAVANGIELFLWSLYVKSYGYAGVAGVTPFATDLSAYLDGRKVGNRQLMDIEPRYMILDVDAEANALGLRAFQDASFGGGTDVIINGQIGRKLGALWAMSQLVPSHTAGTAAGATTNNAGYALGIKTVTLAAAGTGTLVIGDVIDFGVAGQTYTVTAGDADVSNGGTVSFEPGLQTAIPASNTAITKRATHVLNSLIHRDAIGFAMAPLLDSIQLPGSLQAVAIDEVSGLSLRLEVTRQHKQNQWSYDALYGGAVPRPEFWVRIAG